MIVYAETSAVLRWLLNQPAADEVLRHLRNAEKVVTSRVTLIEGNRAILRAATLSKLAEAKGLQLRALLSQAAAQWGILEITGDVAARAERTFPAEPIRTLDAVHLASALALRPLFGDFAMLSADGRIRQNAEMLGLQLLPKFES